MKEHDSWNASKENEPFKSFLRDCYDLISKCQYQAEDDMLLDCLVQGLYDKATKNKLELRADLMLSRLFNSMNW